MLKPLGSARRVWHRLFLVERSSVSLSLFRFFAAFTAGAHVLPTFFRMEDNYLGTAFKEKNLSFFTPEVIAWVDQSPDSLVIFMAAFFIAALICLTLGIGTQAAAIGVLAGCYYFYALNALHIGTLSYDILLVTLVLVAVTPYPGDYFSLDALLHKISASGAEGVPFSRRGFCRCRSPRFLSARPSIKSPPTEMPLALWLAWRKTRPVAVGIGFLFHVMLLTTLHVPTIFFFLFPAQLALFIEAEKVERGLAGLQSLFSPKSSAVKT